jgi:hypothetical protein
MIHQLTCLFLIAMTLSGCTRWRVQSVSPKELVTTRRPYKVRITRPDRSRIVLHQPELIRDTVYGRPNRRGIRQGVALTDVRKVAVRRWDPIGTAVLTVSAAAVASVVYMGVLWSERAD